VVKSEGIGELLRSSPPALQLSVNPAVGAALGLQLVAIREAVDIWRTPCIYHTYEYTAGTINARGSGEEVVRECRVEQTKHRLIATREDSQGTGTVMR